MADKEVFALLSLLVPEGTDEQVVRRNLRGLPIGNPFRVVSPAELEGLILSGRLVPGVRWLTRNDDLPKQHYKTLLACECTLGDLAQASSHTPSAEVLEHVQNEISGVLSDIYEEELTQAERDELELGEAPS